MTRRGTTFRLDVEAQAAVCPEVTISAKLPVPFDHRLSQLVQLANRAGAGADKKWVLAALILDATTDPEHLASIVQNARRAAVGAVVVDVPEGAAEIELDRLPVGRPRKNS